MWSPGYPDAQWADQAAGKPWWRLMELQDIGQLVDPADGAPTAFAIM